MTRPDQDDYDVTESDPDVEGDMGLSSERPGYAGPGQHAVPTGARDTSEQPPPGDEEVPPEQTPGAEEFNPVGLDPKAGYPKLDPRSKDD